MATGLPTSRAINIAWSISSAGASYANVNSLLVIGDSGVIDTTSRIRSYASLSAVGTDFGSTSPEYLAATEFFAQQPTPTQLYIGAWARTATHGQLICASLSGAQQAISNFTAVTAGGFKIALNGASSPTAVTGINLSAATTLSQVASIITTALSSASVAATCVWNGSQFQFITTATGTPASVSFLTPPASGTDISGLLGGAASSGGYPVAAIAAESAIAAVQACDSRPTYWWGLAFAASVAPSDSDIQAVSAYVEATSHAYGFTTSEGGAITSGSTSDIGYALMQAAPTRTFGFYSSTSPYAVIGAFGDLLTANLAGSKTMPTLMWKKIIGATPELLSSGQADALDSKRYNYYATFDDSASIIVNGWCFGDAYVDEIFGLDWLANQCQVDLFNLFTSVPKVAQTDDGMTLVQAIIETALEKGVTNGLIARGLTWQSAGFGSLNEGDVLAKGYYVYIPKVSSQSAASRKTRATPPIQVAIKLAGAVDAADITFTINR